MAAIINGASKIKITSCTFLKDCAQQSKHAKVPVNELKIATFFYAGKVPLL